MPLVLTEYEKKIATERIGFLEDVNESLGERRTELSQGIDEVEPVENLNTRIFDFYDDLARAYETERRGISGKSVETVTGSDIDQAARVEGRLFPDEYDRLPPSRVADLDGGTGQESEYETNGIDEEVAAIDLLLTLDPLDPAYQGAQDAYVAALGEESAAIDIELQGLATNDECGTSHPAYLAGETRKGVVEAIIASPDYSQAALQAERVAALSRRDYVTSRLGEIEGRMPDLWDERYLWLDVRVNLSCGTRNQLFALGDSLLEVDEEVALNETVMARYEGMI